MNNLLDIGYVEAGDTLTLSVTNTDFINILNSFTEEVEPTLQNGYAGLDQLVYYTDDGTNSVRFIPVIEEDSSALPYIEFKLRTDTTFVGVGQSMEVTPNLAFANGSTLYPSGIFTSMAMELYDGTEAFGYFVVDPFFPVPESIVFPATFSPSGETFPLFANNDSSLVGQRLKVRVAGEIIAGVQLGKINSDNSSFIFSTIPGDANCGIDPTTLFEGQFINCFEIPIGNPASNELLVTTEPDSIAPGDTVAFELKLKTLEGDTVGFSSDQLFAVALDEGSKTLGTMFDPESGDTADVLVDVKQGFKFISEELIPDTVDVTGEVVTAIGDNFEIISSSFEVTIAPAYELTIELPDSAQVWPTIPRTGARAEFDFTQVENALENVFVRLKSNGEPLVDREILIRAEWIEGTGGHNHNGGDDQLSPPLTEMGYIVNVAELDSAQGEIFADTDDLGEIELRYRTPEFGGTIELVASYTIGTNTLIARDTITVKVPGLVLLPNGINYSKVGGTPSHHGPRLDGRFQNNRNPDSNHYGTQEFVDFLIELSNTWDTFVQIDTTQDNRQTPLNINDISLINGGLFDIAARWNPAHNYHRVGRDVDIRTTRTLPFTGVFSARNGVLLKRVLNQNGEPLLDDDQNEVFKNQLFEDLLFILGADRDSRVHGIEDEEHYHIYFYNN